MRARLSRCVPVLRVADARRSSAFYGDRLGFALDWQHQLEPGLPLFVSVSRDGVTLFLSEHPESAPGALVYFRVDDVGTLAAELLRRDAVIDAGPVDRPWGMRELDVVDPDGNRLRFGQAIAETR